MPDKIRSTVWSCNINYSFNFLFSVLSFLCVIYNKKCDHRCGLGVTSLLLTQRSRIRSPVGSVSWLWFLPGFSLNRKTNVRKFGPYSSPVIIWPSLLYVYERRWSLTIAVVHGRLCTVCIFEVLGGVNISGHWRP